MTKNAHLSVAAALLLAGCATMQEADPLPRGYTQCTKAGSDVCVITVTVNSCTSIAATPDKAYVARDDVGDVVWKIRGSGPWKFAGNGIAFKNPHRDFSNPRGGNSGEYRWHNAHGEKKKPHGYHIHVTDGRQTCSHDPTVMN